ncbi:MAG: O-methyltransferase [Lachnospiraceae bacterium]|nr:O-methyltransferase [Lachnospiraceae bacterium]
MIVNDRITGFIRSLEPDEPEYLSRIRKKAEEEGVPIVKKETAALLRFLVSAARPERILEIGTAVGYSALLMSECLGGECGDEIAESAGPRITTIEYNEKMIAEARGNISAAGREDMIEILPGDAADVLKTLSPGYDFIFIDAAKGQYLVYLEEAMRLLSSGGIMAADNVLQEGTLAESRYALPHRERTTYSRMREFLWNIKHDERLETAVLSVGDGVSVSFRKG